MYKQRVLPTVLCSIDENREYVVKSSRTPRKITDIVDDIYSIYGMNQAKEEHQALRVWNHIVGDTIAKMTEVEKFVQGVLFVHVMNPSWRTELSFRKKNIISRLNKALGKNLVKDIVFK